VAREADVVVIGGGINGAATLRALARAGARALLLERHELGHTRGSSHGTSRIVRVSYPDAGTVRLAQEALAGWRELEAESGERLVEDTGSLDAGDAAADVERALADAGLPHETLTGAEAAARWPIAFPADERLVYQPQGGFVHAGRAYRALLESAAAAGGVVAQREAAGRIDVTADGVSVTTPSGKVEARAAVVAAGAWSPALLQPLGIDLPVVPTRETVAYFAVPGAPALPPLIEYPSESSPLPGNQAYYALPAPGEGLKAGVHHAGPATDADADAEADAATVAATTAWVARRFPTAVPEPLRAETCIYTNTADEGFVLEAHGRVVVLSACSGHGFKFATLHGMRAARMALEAAT
jgi:sarcosine oxidase